GPARGRTDLPAREELGLDRGTVIGDLDRSRDDLDVAGCRGRATQPDRVLGGHRARRYGGSALLHQVIGGRPVRVTVHERSDHAAGERAVIGLVVPLGTPDRDDRSVAPRPALHTQAAFVARPASEASAVRRVAILERFVHVATDYPRLAAGTDLALLFLDALLVGPT